MWKIEKGDAYMLERYFTNHNCYFIEIYMSYVNNWEKLCIHMKEIVYTCQMWKVEKDDAYKLER